tara:strand:+ start:1764 stop:1958 length:195 start_codon:yes stop_codon:yes gene_type:complete
MMSEQLDIDPYDYPDYYFRLYNENPTWLEGYVQGMRHALQLNKGDAEYFVDTLASIIEVEKDGE